MKKKEFYNEWDEEGVKSLVGDIIRLALDDLLRPHYLPSDAPKNIKYPKKWASRRNKEIDYYKCSAKQFFQGSELFRVTGLNLEDLIREHNKYNQYNVRKLKRR